jgi:outer membrane protein assembly factor BamB
MNDQLDASTPRRPLRLWPGVIVAVLLVLYKLVLPLVGPAGPPLALLGGLVGGVLVFAWWLLFSRARWFERLGAVAISAVALFVTSRFLHPSIAGGDGRLFPILAIPALGLAFVAWAVASHRLSDRLRRVSMVATILIASGAWTLVRIGGIRGDGASELHWRWTPSPEERLLAQDGQPPVTRASGTTVKAPLEAAGRASEAPMAPPSAPPAVRTHEKPPKATANDKPSGLPVAAARLTTPAEWPGFRGPARDGVIHGVRIATDWASSPPVELWRRPIGPGWSSFAVQGDLLYTQEQRGDDEIVACYKVSTGEPVWRHRDTARFWEAVGGAGPRGTPTLSNGRVYTLGATGILNALDAANGAVLWSHNAANDTGAKDPGWGFTSSPLVVNDLVVVATSGRLVAYDAATGHRRWLGPTGGAGYSSPHLITIDGVPQIVLLRGARTTSVSPADGRLLWEYSWQPSVSILQPALADNGDLLIASGDAMIGAGIRRLAIAHKPDGWNVEERWTSRGLKPFYNDFVVHKGHAFGFDGSIFACIDLADGSRKWKGGRYGHGQLVLLPDEDLLLVVSEEGEVALVNATADQFTEVARFKAIEGKTWNHPAMVRDILLVRNGEEMAAFRLSLAGR